MPDEHAAPLTAAAAGMSLGPTSGMRDHARLLAQALPAAGVQCSLHWLERGEAALPAARAEVVAWSRSLAQQLRAERPRALLLHYASFAYAHRGLPVFLRPTLAAARTSRVPVIAVMHELAYPWRRGGARGAVWAASQRLALISLMRACAAAVVTTEQRVDWLASRRWLPRRRVAFAPVYSNLPAPGPGVAVQDGLLGLFGYAYEGASVALVLDALRELREGATREGAHPIEGRTPQGGTGRQGSEATLELLGAPGPGTPTAELWRHEAARRGISQALSFSGRLPAQELSDALARCAVLLCAASPGPTSRKGTLAASLASGRPVVALDGPLTWSELVAQRAARVVAPSPDALARALGALLADPQARAALGARGREFHERRMAVARTAELVATLMREL